MDMTQWKLFLNSVYGKYKGVTTAPRRVRTTEGTPYHHEHLGKTPTGVMVWWPCTVTHGPDTAYRPELVATPGVAGVGDVYDVSNLYPVGWNASR